MNDRRRTDSAALFAVGTVAAAAVALIAAFVVVVRSGSESVSRADGGTAEVVDLDDGAVADPDVDPIALMQRSAASMAEVTSVEFRLERDGAPVFIDQFEEIALDGLHGQFTVPTRAQAELTVTVSGDLPTKIGAVAIGTEVWISNPVTGDFETLPAGYDIDPSRFFDPENGWQPLLANLRDRTRRHRRPRRRPLPRARCRRRRRCPQHHRRPRARSGRAGRLLDPPDDRTRHRRRVHDRDRRRRRRLGARARRLRRQLHDRAAGERP